MQNKTKHSDSVEPNVHQHVQVLMKLDGWIPISTRNLNFHYENLLLTILVCK
jgi:hypothetical protein